ncbi:unnamed protein product [Leptosia nina]|uniref:Uncharacterized protein n=1 Tax=Leptosia nina TaxID=320188 RepID=A0AAV1J6J3_9NEOP
MLIDNVILFIFIPSESTKTRVPSRQIVQETNDPANDERLFSVEILIRFLNRWENSTGGSLTLGDLKFPSLNRTFVHSMLSENGKVSFAWKVWLRFRKANRAEPYNEWACAECIINKEIKNRILSNASPPSRRHAVTPSRRLMSALVSRPSGREAPANCTRFRRLGIVVAISLAKLYLKLNHEVTIKGIQASPKLILTLSRYKNIAEDTSYDTRGRDSIA